MNQSFTPLTLAEAQAIQGGGWPSWQDVKDWFNDTFNDNVDFVVGFMDGFISCTCDE